MRYCNPLKIPVLIITLMILSSMTGCSSEVGVGGASSETTNAVIKFQVDTTSDHETDHSFTYELAETNITPDEYSDSATIGTTDTNGYALVEVSGTTDWYLEIKTDSVGFHKSFSISEGDTIDLGTITLGQFSDIEGSLDLDISHTIEEIILPGSQYSATVDGDGNFRFNDLPPGDWSILASDYDDPVFVILEEDEVIDVYEVNIADDYSDREMLQEVLDKNSDSSKTVDEVATFVNESGREIATIINLSGLNINIPLDSMDGTGLPRMHQMNPIELDFSNNGLEYLPTQWGWHFDRIERLDLSNNKLSNLKESFRDMRSLKYINLKHNELDRIPKDWAVLTPDTVLVEGNKLDGLHSDIEDWLDLYAEPNWRDLQN